jgi:Putative Ig domain
MNPQNPPSREFTNAVAAHLASINSSVAALHAGQGDIPQDAAASVENQLGLIADTLASYVSPVGDPVDPVTAAPVITSANTVNGKVGQSVGFSVVATNHAKRYEAQGLPAGLTIDAKSGIISGVPTAKGHSKVLLKASNDVGTGTGALTINVT